PRVLLTAPARARPARLSLHDALPIWAVRALDPVEAERMARRGPEPPDGGGGMMVAAGVLAAGLYLVPPERRRQERVERRGRTPRDRKRTRLNSSHQIISYAVFCLKKK